MSIYMYIYIYIYIYVYIYVYIYIYIYIHIHIWMLTQQDFHRTIFAPVEYAIGYMPFHLSVRTIQGTLSK